MVNTESFRIFVSNNQLTAEQADRLLKVLTVMDDQKITFDGCGCCGSPWLNIDGRMCDYASNLIK